MYELLPQWLRTTISRAKKQLCGRGHTLDRNATLEQLEGRRLLAITASISGNSSVNEGSNYTLNLSASGGTPIHWDINWGDGYDPDGNGDGKQRVSGNPASVTHKYADGWNFYTVRGTAYETATASYNSNNKFVTVVDVPPTPGISGSAFAYKDRPYVLNLIEHDPGQDTISAWKIDWGDGSAEQTIAGDPASVTHTYATTGTRTITARVVNEDGTFPASPNGYNRRDITVQDGAPLDELLVDSRSDAVVSGTAVLKDGVKYKLVASGWGAMDLNNIRSMDAEYYDTQSATPRDKTSDGIDFGITRAVPWNGGTIATNWGAYRSDHVYEMEITGDGRPLSLKFIDRVGFYNDNAGVLAVAVFPIQRAFGGTAPPQAPGLFEAESFDDGGEGVAYHDNTKGNYYGTQYKRREDADVDIVRDETTGGFEIDHVSAGEWLEYTINVPTAGTYELATRVGAPGTGGVFHWEMDGTDITGPLAVPNTDSHWKYEWVRTNVTLPAGEHVFRLSMDVNGQWLDNRSGVGKFDAFAITNPAAAPGAPTNLAAPFTLRNRVDLTWTDATNNETDYELERGTDGVTFVKVKTLRGNLVSFSDTNLAASTIYHYRLRASNTAGGSSYSNTVAVTTPAAAVTPYKINFQTDHTPPVLGYKVDSGDLYGDRGDGLTYGWNIDHTLQDRDRGTGIDRKLDTLVGMRDGGIWEISLPNGSYDVLVSIGDAHWASTNTLDVEGTNYWDALPLAKNQFRQKTVGVQVTDGKLTLDAGSRPKEGARLNFIEITPGGGATVVNIAATDAVAVENATPANTAMFTMTRQSGNLGGSLPVYFTLFGSAGFPGDYTVVGATPPSGSETRWQVTIPPDQPAATFEIVPVADGVTEPTLIGETVDATLATAPGYTVGNSPSARANIYESTPPPADVVISIELVSSSAIDEGSDQILRYRVSRTGSTAQAQWVNFEALTGTNYSEPGIDWVYHNLSAGASGVGIPKDASEAFIEIRSLEDTVEEGNEPVTLRLLLNGNLYTIDPQADQAAGTIVDDDGDGDGPILVDLDEFEDEDGDGNHDNSDFAEHIEEMDETLFPLTSIADRVKLALVLNDVEANQTLTFAFDPSVFSLSLDAAGNNPLPANTPVTVASLGMSGTGTGILYGGALSAGSADAGISIGTSGAAGTTTVLAGGVLASTTNPSTPEGGGAVDGDGSDPLTNRDNFAFEINPRKLLIVGFAGHTQSLGKRPNGRIWDISPKKGVSKFGQRLKDAGFAVTLFPEDPGNKTAHDPRFCGDGVLGYEPSPGQRQTHTGAFHFVKEAIKQDKVKNLALYGYSHGAGAVRMLVEMLILAATPGNNLYDPDFQNKQWNLIWTGYIDGVNVVPTNANYVDSDGLNEALNKVPLLTPRHYSVWQDATEGVLGPFRLVEPEGAPMEENVSQAILDGNYQIDASNPKAVYHWDKPSKSQPGIEQHAVVQQEIEASFYQGLFEANP